jgi:putative selenium metabolism protein SsnA
MGQLWIKNGNVWTGGDSARVFQGGILCRDENIEAIGSDQKLLPLARANNAKQIDAGGRLIMPGFINAHMHLYSTLARGMALKDQAPENFNQILERLWWRLDKALTLADLPPSAEVVLLDALSAGVTTVIDHHASPKAIEGSLDILAQSAVKLGVRFSTCYEVSDRDGNEIAERGIKENIQFAKSVINEPTLAAMFGLHASFTLSSKTLEACAAAAQDAKLAFHVHVAEAISDVAHAQAEGYQGALERLYKHNVITPNSLAIHCVHTTKKEWKLLSESNSYAVVNPQSNMNNAVGTPPIAKMIEAGTNVGVGTDGMQADVREDIRKSFLLEHHVSQDPRTMWPETGSLIDTNRKIASGLFEMTLGELAPQAAADIVIYDYYPPTEFNADNFMGHFLFGLYNARAHTVIVAGDVKLQDYQSRYGDPVEIAARAREQTASLWKRF